MSRIVIASRILGAPSARATSILIRPAAAAIFLAHHSYPSASLPSRSFFSASKKSDAKPEPVVHHLKDAVPTLEEVHPEPMLPEFMPGQKRLNTQDLEKLPIGIGKHRKPEGLGDYLAFVLVKFLRVPMDLFFAGQYLHRAVTLETVAAVPGMVAGTLRHLTSLRMMRHDGGWISHLLHEAENERMHLLIWVRALKPTLIERMFVAAAQGIFYNAYFVLYLFFPRIAHRFVGYLEEEAVRSYTHMLAQIDNGKLPNVAAPQIAIDYYNLSQQATLRDVVLAVRADEANHRDVNHHFSDRILSKNEDLRVHHTPRIESSKPPEIIGKSGSSPSLQ
ncbi:alternative oxidase [Cladochytrium replicatum]|nr:alternative oxidase [Cladochytrium replicatum]